MRCNAGASIKSKTEFSFREYERVGNAIHRLQDARAVALAGALALIGAVVAAGVNDALATDASPDRSLRVSLLVLFGCLVVIVSALLTGYFTRGVHRLSVDLRDRVEPALSDGGLEEALSRQRSKALNGTPVSSWGASQTFSLIYLITVLFLATLLTFGSDWFQFAQMAMVVPALIISAALSADLGWRFLPFWIK